MVNSSYTYSVFGMAAYTFAIGGLAASVPDVPDQREGCRGTAKIALLGFELGPIMLLSITTARRPSWA